MNSPGGSRPAGFPTEAYRRAWRTLCDTYALAPHERPVRLAGTETAAWTLGTSGPDVVLIHGAGATAASWLPLVSHLSTCRVHLVDLPGFGFGAPHAWDGAPLRDQAQAIIDDLLAALGLGDPILAGNSFGGWLVLAGLLRPSAPERRITVAGLAPGLREGPIPAGTALRGLEAHGVTSGPLHARLSARRGPPPRLHPDPAAVRPAHRRIEAALGDSPGAVESWRSILRAMLTDRGEMSPELDLTDELRASSRQYTYAIGSEDPYLGVLDPRRAETPGAELITIPGAGHLPWFERPRALARIIAGPGDR